MLETHQLHQQLTKQLNQLIAHKTTEQRNRFDYVTTTPTSSNRPNEEQIRAMCRDLGNRFPEYSNLRLVEYDGPDHNLADLTKSNFDFGRSELGLDHESPLITTTLRHFDTLSIPPVY